MAGFVAAAEQAFADGTEERDVAYLSAALAHRANDLAALDLLHGRLKRQFNAALEDPMKDRDLAESQIAAYDTAVRSALIVCRNPKDVDELLERLKDGGTLLDSLRDRVHTELQDLNTILKQPTVSDGDLNGIDSRLRSLPTSRLSDDSVSQLLATARTLADQRKQLERKQVETRVAAIEMEADSSGIALDGLRKLLNQAEQLVLVLAENEGGVDVDAALLTRAISLRDQVDRRVQIRSLHETQKLADLDALKLLEKAQGFLSAGQAAAKEEQFQVAGEKFAQAELTLGAIDRLSSLEVQQQSRAINEIVRREAFLLRSQQEQRYNLWAINRLQESLADYQQALGYFRNNKDAFRWTLQEKVGVIDTQILHPATYTLYQEMFQRLYGGLSNEERAEITRVIELTEKVRISDDALLNSAK